VVWSKKGGKGANERTMPVKGEVSLMLNNIVREPEWGKLNPKEMHIYK